MSCEGYPASRLPGAYSNEGFSRNGHLLRSPQERHNSRLEVRTFQAVNRTFLDDNGEESALFLEPSFAERRRSYASPTRAVSYHRPAYRWASYYFYRYSTGFWSLVLVKWKKDITLIGRKTSTSHHLVILVFYIFLFKNFICLWNYKSIWSNTQSY